MDGWGNIGRIALLGLAAALIGSFIAAMIAMALFEYNTFGYVYTVGYAGSGSQLQHRLWVIARMVPLATLVSLIIAAPATLLLGLPIALKYQHHAARQPWLTAIVAAIVGALIPVIIIVPLAIVSYNPHAINDMPVGEAAAVFTPIFGGAIGFIYALLVARFGRPRAGEKSRRSSRS